MKIWNRILFVFLTIMLIFGSFSQVVGQEKAVSLHIDWVDISNFPQMTVLVSAWNVDGLPLAGLAPENFSLQEDDGEIFQPTSVQADPNVALSVGLVLDISESMFGDPIDDAKAAAIRFLDRLEPGDRAALIAFSSGLDPDPVNLNPNLEIDFTDNLDPLFDLIETLGPGGQTHLYNAAAKAVGLADDEPVGRRAILLLTDGRNEPAELGDPDEAIHLAQKANIPFFVIGLGKDIDEPYLRRLATETGGLFRAAPSSSELGHLFTDMATLLKTQYTLTYPSDLPADGKLHALNITLQTDAGSDTQSIEFGPLPYVTLTPTTTQTAAPTNTPSPTVTVTPSLTPSNTPTDTPTPTPTPTATSTPTPTPIPTFIERVQGSFSIWCPGLLVLGLAALLLIIFRRKPKQKEEKCAKCGFDMTGKPGACPQCGETRRLPKFKQ
ncbi:MAG: VWA domain-containing protein [Chloroflexi bacterium]|nr:VWA domain-containing protein [Chloroflexota bacterium]